MADKILKSLNFGTDDDYYFAQSADRINGVISVENGGFGATTADKARQNIGAASEADLNKICDLFRHLELSETDDGKGNLTIGLVYEYEFDNYVHDSANLFLDGIWNAGEGVHNDSLTSWVDLSGNCQPTPLGTGNTVGENCIISDGTTNGRMIVPDVEPVNLTTFTLEVIYKKGSSDTRNSVICGRDYATSFYTNISNHNLGVWLGNNGKTLAYNLDYSKAHVLQLICDATTATAWVDGVKKAENFSGNVQSTSDKFILFGRKDSQSPLNGSIMAIRLHNRILTEEELARNYMVDKARFGLTEALSTSSLSESE